MALQWCSLGMPIEFIIFMDLRWRIVFRLHQWRWNYFLAGGGGDLSRSSVSKGKQISAVTNECCKNVLTLSPGIGLFISHIFSVVDVIACGELSNYQASSLPWAVNRRCLWRENSFMLQTWVPSFSSNPFTENVREIDPRGVVDAERS